MPRGLIDRDRALVRGLMVMMSVTISAAADPSPASAGLGPSESRSLGAETALTRLIILNFHTNKDGAHQEAGRGLPPGAAPWWDGRQRWLRETDTTTKPRHISKGLILSQTIVENASGSFGSIANHRPG